jgi:hypothetical protein
LEILPKIGRAAGASPIWQNIQTSRFIISMTKLDTYQCQHHILSPKPVLPNFQPKFGAFVRILI